jgi:hypothetical protein
LRRIKARLAEAGFDHATVETCVEPDAEELPTPDAAPI